MTNPRSLPNSGPAKFVDGVIVNRGATISKKALAIQKRTFSRYRINETLRSLGKQSPFGSRVLSNGEPNRTSVLDVWIMSQPNGLFWPNDCEAELPLLTAIPSHLDSLACYGFLARHSDGSMSITNTAKRLWATGEYTAEARRMRSEGRQKYASRFGTGSNSEELEILPPINQDWSSADGTDISVAEGKALLRLHRHRERNRGIIIRKKRQVLQNADRLECEACEFDFQTVYGSIGEGFAECHHRLPFAAAAGERRTRLQDLAIVCANCHRMLHRRPWRSVEALRELVRSRRT